MTNNLTGPYSRHMPAVLLALSLLSFFMIATTASAQRVPLADQVEIDGVTFSLTGSADWFTEQDPELGDATVYLAPSLETPNSRSYMTAEITGPAFVEYYARQYPGSNDLGGLYVDDVAIHRYYSETEWTKYSHQIEAGVHELTFLIDDTNFSVAGNSPVRYADIDIVFGYQVKVDHSGGLVEVTPAKDSYEIGDHVTVSAIPIEGNRFVEWSGSVASDAASIEFTVDGHVNLTAHFEATTLGFGHNLRFSEGVSVFWQSDRVRNAEKALMAIADSGVRNYTISVDVDYGGELKWDRVDYSENYSSSDKKTFHIDGNFVTSFQQYFSPEEYTFSAEVLSGRHELMWMAETTFFRDESAFPMIIENIQFVESNTEKDDYEAWVAEVGLVPGVNDLPGDDPNGDGVPNLGHFAFDTDPLKSGGGLIMRDVETVRIDGEEYLALTLPVRKTIDFGWNAIDHLNWSFLDTKIKVEASADLSAFGDINVLLYDPALGGSYPEPSSGYGYRTFVAYVPLSVNNKMFFSLSVSEAP